MKRIAIVIGVAAALASTAAVCAAPLEAAAPPTTTERYYVKEHWHALSRPNAKDGRPADIYAFQSAVTTTDGKQAGTVDGLGVNLRAPMVSWIVTAALTRGTIVAEGAYALNRPNHVLVIVGGSGSYAGVRGTIALSDAGSRGDLATLTLLR